MNNSTTYVLQLCGSSTERLEEAVLDLGIEAFESSLDETAPWIKIYGENVSLLESYRECLLQKLGPAALCSIAPLSYDWKRAFQGFLQPVKISDSLTICPVTCHYPSPDPREQVVTIDPGLAFGSGSHPSTKLILRTLEKRLRERGDVQVLDVGCGTGVLALSAAKLGAKSVIGFDIDEEAIRVARENALRNGEIETEFLWGSIDKLPTQARFDLICINIISSVVRSLWDDLLTRCAPDARILVSGYLEEEESELLTGLGRPTLRLVQTAREEEWGHAEMAFIGG